MNLSLGTMTIGDQIPSVEEARVLLDMWRKNKLTEIDSAFFYPSLAMEGKTSTMLGEAGLEGLTVSTKANVWTKPGLFTRESVRNQCRGELERLQLKKMDIFYLHSPDHKTPILETLKAVNELYEEGCFERFGISNYAAHEVTEIYYLCEIHKLVKPSVYQGRYNYLSRDVEKEL
jgi:aflatoxin B1 aldehyde reductase